MAFGCTFSDSLRDVGETCKPQYAYGEVSQAGHHLRPILFPDLTSVFVVVPISDIVRAVFDRPMSSIQGEKSFRVCLFRRKGGDAIYCFGSDFS